MKIGLYFGSFNPIHVGHLIIANHMANYADFDQIWLVVSPQNPLKKKATLLKDYHRLALVNIAIEGNEKLKASNIEFKLEIPSYTAITLAHLKEKHPGYSFSLLMGEDNIRTFQKWYNYQEILDNHAVYVYPRAVSIKESELYAEIPKHELMQHKNIHFVVDVPVMNVSSSFIRKAIKEGKSVDYLLTEPVQKYVDEMNFYR
ncbi:MAG: nicotinate (nicotinamide) nucleotide adenylyltransferase [Crocinitomicaceae bacterium]|jgi:nicotinate-nucleotide adenylyltransferase